MDDFATWMAGLGDMDELFGSYDKKRGEEGYIRGVPSGLGRNEVPAIWLNYGRTASASIDRGAQAERRGVTSGAIGARREFERQLLSSYQGLGANQLFAKRALAESRPLVGQQIHGALAGIESGRLREQRELQGNVSGAIAQSYLGERNLIAALHMASKARKTSRSTGQMGALQGALGGIGQAVGAYYGSGGGGSE